MLPFDIESGYTHFRLARRMRDCFLFHYFGRFFRCVALPFGWGRSPLRLTQLISLMVQTIRERGWRVLVNLDDFLVIPSRTGRTAKAKYCKRAREWISRLLILLGVSRHPSKGEWSGAQRVEHLEFVVNSNEIRFYLAPRNMEKVRSLARATERKR
jgi:hypothetical protein